MGGTSLVSSARPRRKAVEDTPAIHNGMIAELLARESDEATGQDLQRAFRRAARSAFLWPIEAAELIVAGRSLTELPSIGPYLDRRIREWLENPPTIPEAPPIRRNFLTMAQAERILARHPSWAENYKGDLQMHSNWSDGAASIADMAQAAEERGYQYIAITDHSKGLKIAGGIDENALANQAEEIQRLQRNLDASGCCSWRAKQTSESPSTQMRTRPFNSNSRNSAWPPLCWPAFPPSASSISCRSTSSSPGWTLCAFKAEAAAMRPIRLEFRRRCD